jgi:hypothetical protein
MEYRGHLAVARSLSATMIADELRGERAAMADEPSDTGQAESSPEPAPFKHTPWQNFIRDLFMMFGPAQTGLPPYATPEEREAWRLANLPESSRAEHKSTAPPGYRIVEYTDSQGYLHRSLVPVAPSPAAPKPPERAQSDEPRPDTTRD